SFAGEFETVTAAGLAPMPVQRPIPIWFGAWAPAALRRAGRLADGWFPQVQPGPDLTAALAEVRAGAAEADRDPAGIGMEGRVGLSHGVLQAAERIAAWRAAGATHVSVNTMGCGAIGVDGHI